MIGAERGVITIIHVHCLSFTGRAFSQPITRSGVSLRAANSIVVTVGN